MLNDIRRAWRRMLYWLRMQEIHRLEQQIVTELRVLAVIFGNRPAIHSQWAAAAMHPPEYVDYYLTGWRAGRRMAWRRIVHMTERLHGLTGEDADAWASRLHRLELVSGADVLSLRPTTQRMLV
jgi:hypothetical protein